MSASPKGDVPVTTTVLTPSPTTPDDVAHTQAIIADPVSQCSTTDASAAAVLRCANAVRTNPRAFASRYPCTSSTWLAGVSTPVRPALKSNSALAQAALRHARDMAR